MFPSSNSWSSGVLDNYNIGLVGYVQAGFLLSTEGSVKIAVIVYNCNYLSLLSLLHPFSWGKEVSFEAASELVFLGSLGTNHWVFIQ